MHPLRVHYDKLLLAAAVLLLVAAVAWTQRERARVRHVLAQPAAVRAAVTVAVSEQVVAPTPSAPLWAARALEEQKADLFTPPLMRESGSMAAAVSEAPALPTEDGNGMALLAVRKAPYRLQLVGYVGRPGSYRVALADAVTSETVLARVGQRLEGLGLKLVRFDLRPVAVSANEAGPVHEAVAIAVLEDEATGNEVALDTRGPRFTDRLLAAIRISERDHDVWEGGEGDGFATEGAAYRIEHIRHEPAEVVLVRSARDQPAASRMLRLVQAGARQTPAAISAGDEPPRVVAHHE